ncbi:hypothetical protein IWQ60_001628 [Tieghemiomyces parasiticus]|uniref:Uncharacterized protein n=1 Tax=Tieghemiomyces parasiticus TaxID=78921 RepID=A0A9W8E1R9_9FUNG|nr:hypothetical protein IWQ60_001628 [Tieghemiomyces parasiticus]
MYAQSLALGVDTLIVCQAAPIQSPGARVHLNMPLSAFSTKSSSDSSSMANSAGNSAGSDFQSDAGRSDSFSNVIRVISARSRSTDDV